MFGGSFTHKLDEVGRFIVPRKFRFSLGEKFVITRGIGCLLVLTSDRFHAIFQQAQGLGDPLSVLFNPEISRLYRHLFSEMVETNVDGQGRVQLTSELRAYAEIDKDVVIMGVGDWLEIWGAENWQSYKENSLTPEQLIRAASQALECREGGEQDESVSPPGDAE
ncbi:MAG: cell division/cell wall cluster transcriptional repressor MraZ [Armatimonadetes bacterium]|nr:cell division/cell wall cluster transcriptional repressor MraZ [Armatimonadota bacterium]